MEHRPSSVVVPVLALALAACTTDAPTAPPAEAPPVALAVEGEALTALRGTVADASVRLLPALGDAGVQSRLSGVLAGVQTALEANDADALAAALEAARSSLDAERLALGPDSPAAAELDVLALTLGGLDDALPETLRARLSTKR